ncbi:type II toxin-antitoxin system RelE/ParE family toxin [Thermodesulfobacteriota bacterium]
MVLDAVEDVVANPEKGELKAGDLKNFRVVKFLMNRQLTLMAYKLENDSIIFYQVGSHENFYKNLKRYLKEIGG